MVVADEFFGGAGVSKIDRLRRAREGGRCDVIVIVDVPVIVGAPVIVAALGNGNANVGVADAVDDRASRGIRAEV